jgi:AcrR family transcriptional regulator
VQEATEVSEKEPDESAEVAGLQEGGALARAASRALPLVQERRGTQLRDTRGVARRLTTTAIDLFVRDGYDAVTINDIAVSAGVNRRTFFRYFPSKETLILDIWDQTNATLLHLIAEAAESEPLAALRAAVVAWCERYEDLLTGLADVSKQSRTLQSITMLHATEWEEKIGQALLRRFPELDHDVAEVSGIVAMGALRVGRKRVLRSGLRYPVAVEQVFAALIVDRSTALSR